MKNYLLLIIIAFFIAACGSNNAGEEAATEDTLALYSWEAALNDSTGQLEVNKKEAAGPDSLTAPAVIAFLNARNPHIQLKLLGVSADTLYVSIPDAHYLTQQMGSTGPQLFFAEAVYNLTEIPGIRYVNFDFEEGDHAGPEVFSRNSFRDE